MSYRHRLEASAAQLGNELKLQESVYLPRGFVPFNSKTAAKKKLTTILSSPLFLRGNVKRIINNWKSQLQTERSFIPTARLNREANEGIGGKWVPTRKKCARKAFTHFSFAVVHFFHYSFFKYVVKSRLHRLWLSFGIIIRMSKGSKAPIVRVQELSYFFRGTCNIIVSRNKLKASARKEGCTYYTATRVTTECIQQHITSLYILWSSLFERVYGWKFPELTARGLIHPLWKYCKKPYSHDLC